MTILVFVLSHFFTCTSYSSGPNEDLNLGFTAWIHLHRSGFSWSVVHFNLFALFGEICLAILFTWIFSWLLTSFKTRKIM